VAAQTRADHQDVHRPSVTPAYPVWPVGINPFAIVVVGTEGTLEFGVPAENMRLAGKALDLVDVSAVHD